MNDLIKELFKDFDCFQNEILNDESFPVYNAKEKVPYTECVNEFISSKFKNHYTLKFSDQNYDHSFIFLEVEVKNLSGYVPSLVLLDYDKIKEKYKITEIEYRNEKGITIYLESNTDSRTKKAEIEHFESNESVNMKFNVKNNEGVHSIKTNNKKFESFLSECDTLEKKEELILKLFHFKNYSIEEQEIEKLRYEQSINQSFFAGKINFLKDALNQQPKLQKKILNHYN